MSCPSCGAPYVDFLVSPKAPTFLTMKIVQPVQIVTLRMRVDLLGVEYELPAVRRHIEAALLQNFQPEAVLVSAHKYLRIKHLVTCRKLREEHAVDSPSGARAREGGIEVFGLPLMMVPCAGIDFLRVAVKGDAIESAAWEDFEAAIIRLMD